MVTYPENPSNRVNQQVDLLIITMVFYMQIYKITNLATGLSYVGKDQRDDPKYMGSGILLWQSYRKRFGRPDLDANKKSHHK